MFICKIPKEGELSFEEVLIYEKNNTQKGFCNAILSNEEQKSYINEQIRDYIEQNDKGQKKYTYFIAEDCIITNITLDKIHPFLFTPNITLVQDDYMVHLYRTTKLYFDSTVEFKTYFINH